ncbi:MAG: N-acetyltransferase [Proteobacteria bacterium]|nr:N-acetyltransferase [Pseudomonadota bacterium]
MSEITIKKEDDGQRGRYVVSVGGIDAEGELVFTHRGANLISADHTVVPNSLKGTGAAAALVDYLIADARAHAFKIIPYCPYVRARYETHPEWQDVMTVAPGVIPLR